MAADFRSVNRSEMVANDASVRSVPRWSTPIIGFYKLNVDTSFNSVTRKAWGGMVLCCYRDHIFFACEAAIGHLLWVEGCSSARYFGAACGV